MHLHKSIKEVRGGKVCCLVPLGILVTYLSVICGVAFKLFANVN